jgi:antitoxin VapB
MPFHIRSSEAESLLRELQHLTGETLTETVRKALAERLERERSKRHSPEDDPEEAMREIWARLEMVPNRDPRPDDEILGYGPDGLPH